MGCTLTKEPHDRKEPAKGKPAIDKRLSATVDVGPQTPFVSMAEQPSGERRSRNKASRSAKEAVAWPWPLPPAAVLPPKEAASSNVTHRDAAPSRENQAVDESPASLGQSSEPAENEAAGLRKQPSLTWAGQKVQMMAFAPLEFSGRPVTELCPAPSTTAPADQGQHKQAQCQPQLSPSSYLSAKSGRNGLEQSFLTTVDHTCGMLAPPAFGKAADGSYHLSGVSQLGKSGLAQSLLPFYEGSSGQASSNDDDMDMPRFPQLIELAELGQDDPKADPAMQRSAFGSSSAGSAKRYSGSASDAMQKSLAPFHGASLRTGPDAASSASSFAQSLCGFYDGTTAAAPPTTPVPTTTTPAGPAMLLPPPDIVVAVATGDFSLRSVSSGERPMLSLTTPRGCQTTFPTMPDSFEPVPEEEAANASDELLDTHAPENPFALPTFGA